MKQKYYKIIIHLIFYFCFSVLFGYENKIIVKVNNEVVTNYDLKNKILTTLVLTNEKINKNNINKTKPIVLKNLIDLKIKESEVKKYKIKSTPEELQSNLNILSNNDLNSFKKKFESNNLNYEMYKKDLDIELKWRKLIYVLYKKKVSINESEINLELDEFLKKNERSSNEYKLSELMISFDNDEDKKKKIQEINNEFKNIDFDKVLLKYSESINKSELGDLGWVNSKSLSQEIFSKIKDLKISEISEPIIIGNNILYLNIKDIRKIEIDLKDEDLKKIKKQILSTKENQRFMLYSNSHLSKLKNLTTIEYK